MSEAQSAAQKEGAGSQVTVVLVQASLETVKTRKGDFELLNCDDHRGILKKHGRNPSEPRPDILHQCLMALLDSPLNKAGRLQVFIHSSNNVLIRVNPKIRIPRTFKRFSGLMVQLLHKLQVRAAGGSSETLLKVVKNPVSQHLPPGCAGYAVECTGDLFNPAHFAASLPAEKPIVFVVGAMAEGNIDKADWEFVEQLISISEFPLSGATALNRLLGAVENHWGIV